MRKSNRKVIKIVLLGDGGVGKTSLRKRYLGESMQESYSMTVGADFSVKRIGSNIIQIYDLAGQPGFNLIRKNYYMGAQGLILVFDISKRSSFINIDKWLNEIVLAQGKSLPTVLVGNKIDLRNGNENFITKEEGNKAAERLNNETSEPVIYVEASALDGINVDKIFNHLTKVLMGIDPQEEREDEILSNKAKEEEPGISETELNKTNQVKKEKKSDIPRAKNPFDRSNT